MSMTPDQAQRLVGVLHAAAAAVENMGSVERAAVLILLSNYAASLLDEQEIEEAKVMCLEIHTFVVEQEQRGPRTGSPRRRAAGHGRIGVLARRRGRVL